MKHRVKSEKFSRNRAQRKALVKSLLRSLVIYERIVTQEAKAKKMRPWVDMLITWAKEDTLHHRRLSYRFLEDHNLVKRLFEVIGPRFKGIPGGFTRIIDIGFRKGDTSKMAIFELTKIEKKERLHKEKKEKAKEVSEEKHEEHEERTTHKKEEQSKKGLLSGVRKIFKRERDSL
ncbi:MAG: 50S ribosomal protein L17 [Candidatus Omnitrophica bacterium]|nr:50S ribosomal protein L17 [Candidatus Omnitrophota bacterium]